MAIANVLESMKTHISNAYSILASKDTPMPEHKNLANLANTIENIPSTAKLIQVVSDPSYSTPFNLTAEDLKGVVRLRPYAFYGSALNFVELPNTLTDIGAYAFGECVYFDETQRLIIPNSVIYIGESAFSSARLRGITLSSNLTSISYDTFSGCYSLRSITLNDILSVIGQAAFKNCANLPTITLPASLTGIGEEAFSGCQMLMHITFQGTIAQWQNIRKDTNWDLNTPNYTVHCTDGDLPKQ